MSRLSSIADRLRELDPSDDYHADETLDERSYYAAIDRAVKIISGDLTDWRDTAREVTR